LAYHDTARDHITHPKLLVTVSGAKRRDFGSFARAEDRPDSDIDILVRFSNTIDLLTLVRMHRELSELLQRKVDIVTENSLHPSLRPFIEKDLKIIVEA